MVLGNLHCLHGTHDRHTGIDRHHRDFVEYLTDRSAIWWNNTGGELHLNSSISSIDGEPER